MAVNLPSILKEDTHFYKAYENELKQYLGKPYISYSTMNSFLDPKYIGDFIKSKLLGIKSPGTVYTHFGTYVGEAIEKNYFAEDNPYGFLGKENIDLSKYRKPDAEYEKLIVIDRGEYIIVGFIDIYYEEDGVKYLKDNKTGGKGKESEYTSDDYLQTVLYNYALGGDCITSVNFFRREGSHINPPLRITTEQFEIPVEYNEKRVKQALGKMDKAVKGISELKTTYDKFFVN